MARGEHLSRRTFLEGMARGAAGGLGASAAWGALGTRVLGANERIRLGFIGTGGRGRSHIGQFRTMPDVEIVAVCDVDQGQLDQGARLAGGRVEKLKDFRKLLDMKEIDAVVISPPDHWHAIPTIQACKAGKDVYVEKPIGHNIREGRVMADVASKEGRIVVIGLQQRSGPHWIEAVRRIHSGEIGKVSLVSAWNAWAMNEMGGRGPEGIGSPPDSDPPPGVDYDMWLGPAPKRRFNPNRFHFYFYFFWEYSGGMVSAWGVHLFDIVQWVMGTDILSVTASGGEYIFDDSRDTPDTAEVIFDCPGYTLTYSMRHANGYRFHGNMDHGIHFFGTKGTLTINRNGFQIYPEGSRDRPMSFPGGDMDLPHKMNFLECLRTRKKPNADAEVGHLSAIPGHLANISYRVGRRIVWDPRKETIVGDPEAAKLLTREYRAPWAV